MTQISRPFQIALAALVLIVAVWFVALRGHSSSGSSSEASTTSAVSSPVSAPPHRLLPGVLQALPNRRQVALRALARTRLSTQLRAARAN